jgi:hypothetical protein
MSLQLTSHRSNLVRRVAGAVALVGVALVHVLDLPDKLAEAHYMAALFIALIGVCLVLAGLLVADRRTSLAWQAAALVCALTIVGYVWSRTIGLPQLADHIGMWNDPLGWTSLALESLTIALAVPDLRPSLGPRLQPRLS